MGRVRVFLASLLLLTVLSMAQAEPVDGSSSAIIGDSQKLFGADRPFDIPTNNLMDFMVGSHALAEEVRWAQEQFIELVKNHPESFKDVDIRQLEAIKPKIFMIPGPFRICGSDFRLQAYSDFALGWSVFDFHAWWKMRNWQEKLVLAAHELLVLTGMEPSNRYGISNRIFQFQVTPPQELAKRPEWIDQLATDTLNSISELNSWMINWTKTPNASSQDQVLANYDKLLTDWRTSFVKIAGIESVWRGGHFTRSSHELWDNLLKHYAPMLKQVYASKSYWYLKADCIDHLDNEGVTE